MSQLYSLIYMNCLDQYIVRELKPQSYCRYVDDFVLFGITAEEANTYKILIDNYLEANLKLELSKYGIRKAKHGINFVGFRTYTDKRYIRKH